MTLLKEVNDIFIHVTVVLGRPGVDGTIILRWIFGKRDVGVWTGWS